MKNKTFHESDRLAPEGEQKLVLVDIDETICFYSGKRSYDLAEPHEENIAKINKLYDEGWKVIYWTARGTLTGFDWREVTEQQFADWGVKYHDLSFGKPYYDLFIDDKAINSLSFFNGESYEPSIDSGKD